MGTEIQVVCGGLLLLNSHCPFERQAESLPVSLPRSAPRNPETLAALLTHTLVVKKQEEEIPESIIKIQSNGKGTET